MYRDNVPAVCLQQFPLTADLYEDDFVTGVRPILFAENPADAEAVVMINQDVARRDIMKLQKAFFAPENLSSVEAVKVCKRNLFKNIVMYTITE
jgi:hypothetical protein